MHLHRFAVPLLLAGLTSATLHAQAWRGGWTGYKAIVDLKTLKDDRARVTLTVPPIAADTATLVFPATTPGTYERQDWYRYIRNLRAVDTNGQELPVRRTADGQFFVSGTRALDFVTYEVDDSFDEQDTTIPASFNPVGTSFQKDSIFQLNHQGLIGYVEGLQKRPYSIMIQKPAHLLGASALRIEHLSDTVDVYGTADYDELVDNPVLYAVPDTASFTVGKTRVLVACAGNPGSAPAFAEVLQHTCATVAAFLPTMPVDRYAFLIYLWNGDRTHVSFRKPGFGALEHSYSSLYFMPGNRGTDGMSSIAAHEFLHILVPLNLHSGEIDTFDFRSPRMSQHLWLYEGATEYFSHLAQVRDSSVSLADFVALMRGKVAAYAGKMPETFVFTDFSRNVLTDENQELYPIVYTYGAVNAFLMDILLRDQTDGRMGLLELVYDLMKEYGPSRPFRDDALWDDIAKRTTPAVADYCKRHIRGSEPLPVASILQKIGWRYDEVTEKDGFSFGIDGVYEVRNGKPGYYISPKNDNPMKVVAGDRMTHINGKLVEETERSDWEEFARPKAGSTFSMAVERNGEIVELSGQASPARVKDRHVITVDESAGQTAKTLQRRVLYGR